MSRARFGLLLGLAAVAVAIGAFVVGLRAFDDGGPDRPPSDTRTDGGGADGEADDGEADGDAADGAPTSSLPAEGAGPLPSPSWLLVVSSEGDEDRAREVAEAIAAAGHAAGVLRSDDHPSLNPGFWVAYAGPYPDADAARAARTEVQEDGFPAAYVRCAGTTADCGGDEPAAEDGGEDPAAA